jgi:hypothetical protein
MRVALVELLHLAVRAPLEVATPGVPQIDLRDFLDAPAGVEPGGDFTRQRLVLNKAVVVGGSYRLLVQTHCISVPPFEAGDLGGHERAFVGEGRRIVFGPFAQLFLGRRQEVTPSLLLVGRTVLIERRHRQRRIVKVVEPLDMDG